jgi:hypothetical protein
MPLSRESRLRCTMAMGMVGTVEDCSFCCSKCSNEAVISGTYDYATIPYDNYIANAEACQRHYLSRPYHHYRRQAADGTEEGSTCRSIRVEIPRVPHMGCPPPFCSDNCSTARIVPATRDAVHAMMREHSNGSASHLHVQPLQPNHDYHQTAEESQGGIRTGRLFRSAPPEFPPPPPPEGTVAMLGNCGCDCSPGAVYGAYKIAHPH